jgi:hypothetical protein
VLVSVLGTTCDVDLSAVWEPDLVGMFGMGLLRTLRYLGHKLANNGLLLVHWQYKSV